MREKKQILTTQTISNWKKKFIEEGSLLKETTAEEVPLEKENLTSSSVKDAQSADKTPIAEATKAKATDENTCPDCGRVCASPAGLFAHRKINCKATQKETQCPVCKRVFKSEWGCRVHISAVHPDYIIESLDKKIKLEEAVREQKSGETINLLQRFIRGDTDETISVEMHIEPSEVHDLRIEFEKEHSLKFPEKESSENNKKDKTTLSVREKALNCLAIGDGSEEETQALLCMTCEITRITADTYDGVRGWVKDWCCHSCVGNPDHEESETILLWHPRKDLKDAIRKAILNGGNRDANDNAL
jgi:hypothetical protein